MGWNTPNFIATIGAFILGIGIAIYFITIIYTYFKGEKAGRDPWDARTLEWSLPNPPPEYNFAVTPSVHARDAFWYEKHNREEATKEKTQHAHAESAHGGIHMPSQSWFPILTAGGMLIGGLFLANHNYVGAICGGGLTLLFSYLWALEGPGGYHVHAGPEVSAKDTHANH